MKAAVVAIRLRALGDVVQTTPALRALARGFPQARLEVVTERRYAPLLEGLEGVERVWPLDRSARATLSLIGALRAQRVDRVVDFFGNPRSALIARGCGAGVRAGYELRGRRHVYQVRVPRAAELPGGRREHAAATHVRLAVAAGGVADGLEPRVTVRPEARSAGADLLERAGVRSPRRAVGLVAAGTWPTKTWPVSHAALLARALIDAGREVLLLSGPGEDGVARALTALVRGIRVLPPCDLPALAGAIGGLGAVVGTDSGPRHVAAALGVPTFAWFGPTHPDTWNPIGEGHAFLQADVPCRGCDRTSCPHWNCLPSINPGVAASRVLDHLERHGRPADLDRSDRA